MKFLLLLFLLLCGSIVLQAEDIVTLESGETITGVITSVNDSTIAIDRGENTLTLQRKYVKSFSFDTKSRTKDIVSFGITYGLPGILNLTTAYSSDYFHTRIVAGFVPSDDFVAGIEGIVGFPIYGSEKALIAPSVFLGTIDGWKDYYMNGNILSFDDTYSYYGFGIDVQIYGVTALIGYGLELDENIHGNNLIFDIGYQFVWY